MNHPIPFIKPRFPEPDLLTEDIKRIYKNNYYSNNGPVYYEFKNSIETFLRQGIHAVIVSNATLGLMLAMVAAFDKKGKNKKYVAVPSFTFAAGPLAIKWCGYEPVFFDIEPDTTQPSLASFETVLEEYKEQLAGVLLINSFGIGNEQIDEWAERLAANGLPFIIDSAPGFGSSYANGNLLGGEGACEIFSFHATKPFGIGEGGLITTKDKRLAERIELLKNFGFNDDKMADGMGINAKITELDCAIGLRILENYPATLQDRRQTYLHIAQNFENVAVKLLPRAETSTIQFASIMVDSTKRNTILSALKEGGVEARTYYAPPVHAAPFFREAAKVPLSNTEKISESIISLPVHPHMEAATVDYICEIVVNNL